MRARGGQLHRLAAGGGAHVQHRLARRGGEDARRQGGGGVLHPPRALPVSGQGRNLRAAGQAHRARRHHRAAKPRGPVPGAFLHGQVQRRAAGMGPFHRLDHRPAVIGDQRLAQPPGQPRRGEFLPRLRPGRGQPAQHRVGQPGQAGGAPARAHDLDGGIDHPVRRRALGEHLDHGQAQHVVHMQRRAVLEEGAEHPVGPVHLAQAAQRQTGGAGPFGGVQPLQRAGQELRQQPALAQHRIEQPDGGLAGGGCGMGHGGFLTACRCWQAPISPG